MKTFIKIFLTYALASASFISGCAVSNQRSSFNTASAGLSVKGKTIKYTKFGSGPHTILLLGSIHGDEQAGAALLDKFEGFLKENRNLLSDKTVIIIPIANPDGFAKKTRFNADKIDINRNFPADNRINDANKGYFALSEPESWGLYKIINTFKPAGILTFHESLGCIDYDGPAQDIAGRLAAKCNLPVRKLGSRPGSLGSYAGNTLNIPIITVELSDEDSKLSAEKLWNRYKDMLIEAVSF